MSRLIPKNEEENVLFLYWLMLTTLEHTIDIKKDLIDKGDVEAGYRVWNRVHGTNLSPYWDEGQEGVVIKFPSPHKA